jgi:hypothetical protein
MHVLVPRAAGPVEQVEVLLRWVDERQVLRRVADTLNAAGSILLAGGWLDNHRSSKTVRVHVSSQRSAPGTMLLGRHPRAKCNRIPHYS